jgi:CHAT domain-containing protein
MNKRTWHRTGFLLLPLLITLSAPGCVEQKMTVKEAREVAVSMSGESFTPPPRRITDILSVLNQPRSKDTEALAKMRETAVASAPAGGSDQKLMIFLKKRGRARMELGQIPQALKDLRKAYRLMKKTRQWDQVIERELGAAEMQAGNLRRAIDLFHTHVKHDRAAGMAYWQLVKLYGRMGDFEAAQKARAKGIAFSDKRYKKTVAQHRPWRKVNMASPNYFFLSAQGKYAEAEPYARKALEGYIEGQRVLPRGVPLGRMLLAFNLLRQGRLMEAELEARQAISDALDLGEGVMTGYALSSLGGVLMAQGRLREAEQIFSASVALMEKLNFPADSQSMSWAKTKVGVALSAQEQYGRATNLFKAVRDGLVTNRFLYESLFSRNPSVIFAFIMAGQTEEAMEMIDRAEPVIRQGMGESSYRGAELRAFRAMTHARNGHIDAAMDDFSAAVPVLIEQRDTAQNHAACLRLSHIIEAYMDVLRQIRDSSSANRYGFDITETIFRMAESLSGSKVQQALGASGARAAISDPALADLARRAQDATEQIKTLQETLTNLLATPSDQQDPQARKGLKTGIASLEKALAALNEEIRSQFPKYAEFIDPKPLGFKALQSLLHAKEALVVLATTQNRTYAWAIPPAGEVAFASTDIGRNAMKTRVSKLRKALDPGPGTFGDIPDFDLSGAHDIYRQVLAPVAEGWKAAEDLVVVATGPLGQIPLALLPTAPVEQGRPETLLFENFQTVPWLIRKVSITRAPSAAAFALQRQVPPGSPDRRAFAGFGDPIYHPGQIDEAEKQPVELASRGARLRVRGVRVTQKGALDNEKMVTSHIELLNRLPDTADEIESIAQAIGAEPAKDVYLGQRASEDAVKSMDLSDRRVIAFASHALIPGDLDGLDQPALALSAPSVTGLSDDGLLTMGEVMHLNLNADWVVLSACNTGAAEGAGGEAVSGLGRAFFYAGTRALLVSMWPVETTSAKKLTTRLFEVQTQSPGISRARAFRQSVLDLMDGPGIFDQTTGKTVASYAHPLFWAPFIIVGEAGGNGTVSN